MSISPTSTSSPFMSPQSVRAEKIEKRALAQSDNNPDRAYDLFKTEHAVTLAGIQHMLDQNKILQERLKKIKAGKSEALKAKISAVEADLQTQYRSFLKVYETKEQQFKPLQQSKNALETQKLDSTMQKGILAEMAAVNRDIETQFSELPAPEKDRLRVQSFWAANQAAIQQRNRVEGHAIRLPAPPTEEP